MLLSNFRNKNEIIYHWWWNIFIIWHQKIVTLLLRHVGCDFKGILFSVCSYEQTSVCLNIQVLICRFFLIRSKIGKWHWRAKNAKLILAHFWQKVGKSYSAAIIIQCFFQDKFKHFVFIYIALKILITCPYRVYNIDALSTILRSFCLQFRRFCLHRDAW